MQTGVLSLTAGPRPAHWAGATFRLRVIAFAIDSVCCYLPAYIGFLYAASLLYGIRQPFGLLQILPLTFLGALGQDSESVLQFSNFLYQHLGLLTALSSLVALCMRLAQRHDRPSLFREPRNPSNDSSPGDRLWGTGLRTIEIVLLLVGLTFVTAGAAGFVWIYQHFEPTWTGGTSPSRGVLLPVELVRELVLPLLLGYIAAWEGNGQTLGCRALGLQVQSANRRPAGLPRLALRDGIVRPLLGWWLALVIVNLGVLIPLPTLGFLAFLIMHRLTGYFGFPPIGWLDRALLGDQESRTIYDRWLRTRTVYDSTVSPLAHWLTGTSPVSDGAPAPALSVPGEPSAIPPANTTPHQLDQVVGSLVSVGWQPQWRSEDGTKLAFARSDQRIVLRQAANGTIHQTGDIHLDLSGLTAPGASGLLKASGTPAWVFVFGAAATAAIVLGFFSYASGVLSYPSESSGAANADAGQVTLRIQAKGCWQGTAHRTFPDEAPVIGDLSGCGSQAYHLPLQLGPHDTFGVDLTSRNGGSVTVSLDCGRGPLTDTGSGEGRAIVQCSPDGASGVR